jgi:hypothetical protein
VVLPVGVGIALRGAIPEQTSEDPPPAAIGDNPPPSPESRANTRFLWIVSHPRRSAGAVYGTEGREFESLRARLESPDYRGFSLLVDRTPGLTKERLGLT